MSYEPVESRRCRVCTCLPLRKPGSLIVPSPDHTRNRLFDPASSLPLNKCAYTQDSVPTCLAKLDSSDGSHCNVMPNPEPRNTTELASIWILPSLALDEASQPSGTLPCPPSPPPSRDSKTVYRNSNSCAVSAITNRGLAGRCSLHREREAYR